MRAQPDCAVEANVGDELLMQDWFPCGDDWFIQMATNAAFTDALLDKALALRLLHAGRIVDAIGEGNLDGAICNGDDLGSQTGKQSHRITFRRARWLFS